jgi:hypothetical protein
VTENFVVGAGRAVICVRQAARSLSTMDNRDVLFHRLTLTCEVRAITPERRAWLQGIFPYTTSHTIYIPSSDAAVVMHAATAAGLNCGQKLGY